MKAFCALKMAAVASSLLAALGGTWLLACAKWHDTSDAMMIGIGFYLLAKAFFLGPTLWLMAARVCGAPSRET